MNYKRSRIGDLCIVTKGSTGIKKAIPGIYPLVTLAEERASHSEYQFDCAAAIIPLVSSTGHGHASMKRLHFQEGRFALGSILCAAVPKDPKQLSAKYLYLYLTHFKDSLLIPLMSGAANVSLSVSKIENIEILVPSIDRQTEIESVMEKLDELQKKLSDEKIYLEELSKALLRESFESIEANT